MSSLLDLGLIRTAAVEAVVTPIACHLCHLVLLCDGAEDPEHFVQLEGAARAVSQATENMAAAASRHVGETEDEVLRAEMASLLEPVAVSGRHVLLAAQKLCIQPELPEHREELISAAQNVFLGVVKVLTVNDDAAVRKVVRAADQLLERLSQLGSCSDIQSLLGAFQTFSDALLLLNALTVERAQSLQDPAQSQELLDSLETLKKCISMLHTASCTTIQHPTSEPAHAAKSYILERVRSAVCDITATLKSEGHRQSPGPCGFYTETREGLLQALAASPEPAELGGIFDSLLRDLVFHCMVVANSSRGELQHTLVLHCRHILQLWSDMKEPPDDPECSEEYQPRIGALLAEQIQTLDGALMVAVLHQVLDTFLDASSVFEELFSATRQALAADSSSDIDLSLIQPLLEDFISYTDRLAQVAQLVSAVAEDAKSLENVVNSRVCLSRLRAQIAPLSLELEDNSTPTVQKLFEMCEKWEEATGQLQDAISDVMDVREFTAIAVAEMAMDRRGCDGAYREQSYSLFEEHASTLVSHMKQVTRSVRRHLDGSDDPIYRNGLLVLLKQVQTHQIKVNQSVKDMLSGRRLNVEAYSMFSDSVSSAIRSFKVLREGLDGRQHPHLLSPLRAGARLGWEESEDPAARRSDAPALEVIERDFQSEHEEEHSDEETIEAELPHKYDSDDLKTPAVSDEPKPTHMPLEFDLLPLIYDVLTVTKGKDVTDLNRACTAVLELSNCYAQAAREALAVVDVVDGEMLESFRAELVSLTPLLVQTAQETAMSSAMSTESICRHGTQFSDLINNMRRVLLPVAGTWFHAAQAELRGGRTGTVTRQLSEIMDSCTDVVQLLTSTDLTSQGGGQETFSVLHAKLNKAQNNTRALVEFSTSEQGRAEQLEGLCVLWGLSLQVLFDSLDKILGTSTAVSPLSPQKQLLVLSENSLRLQEAARLTSLNCKSAFRSKQLTRHRDELKTLTDSFLQAADDLGMMPGVMQLARSELFQRKLLIKLRELSALLSKANKNYDTALRSVASTAYSAAEDLGESTQDGAEQDFDRAAQKLLEDVKSATRRTEDCLNYVRDPRARSNLRSINDHLSFQISDIIGRARLIVETRHVCDTLSLEVQIQCWSAKAHFTAEEIAKQDGIHQEVKEHIRDGLQGRTPGASKDVLSTSQTGEGGPQTTPAVASWPKTSVENVDAAEANMSTSAVMKYGTGNTEKDDRLGSGAYKEASSLTYTSLFLKQESDAWDPQDNRIVQETRRMADVICYMTQYLKRKGPLLNKEAFVTAAKDVISNCQSVTQFIRVIANHCLDKQCTVELSIIVEQILTITNQLSIISNVKAVTPGCKSSDEILVKNAQNLLQTVLRGVRAAETACIMGLKQPEPNSDGAEATALCFQWKRNLEIHRAQQTSNPETDELGLRKTSSHPMAPSLAPFVQDTCKFPLSSQKTSGIYGLKNTF